MVWHETTAMDEKLRFIAEYLKKPAISVAAAAPAEEKPVVVSTERSSKVRVDIPIPHVPTLDRKVRLVPELPEV